MDETIQKLLSPGKGLLAADESTKTITKRLAGIGVTSTPEINRKYRQMLITTPGIENYISGIIFYDETVRQKLDNGQAFPDYVSSLGIIPGIKVDEGLEPFEGTEQEITKGVDSLPQRLDEYSKMGLKFTKWRGVFKISDIFPTDAFLNENLDRMINFIKVSQENNLVPIAEPEVLLDGNHTNARCEEITTKVLKTLFEKANAAGVPLSNLILKTNMVLPGKDSGVIAASLEVAGSTLRTLRNSVPKEVPGIVFLSGGQTSWDAIDHLDKIEDMAAGDPWKISFSYSRALQEEPQKVWAGKDENADEAQTVFLAKLKEVGLARKGEL